MKKFIVCLLGAVILMNCNIRVEPSSANAQELKYAKSTHVDVTIDNMLYRAFINERSSGGTTMDVINLTKDSLEVELIRLQIANLKKP